MIKATSDEHHDYATIKQALLEIKSVVDQVNKRTRQEARVKRMLDLQNQILHGEVPTTRFTYLRPALLMCVVCAVRVVRLRWRRRSTFWIAIGTW